MVRAVAASLALLAGCYSPSFVPCQLACSTEDKCPSGLTCSTAGFCAPAGTQCDGDGGVVADSSVASCGNGEADPGEICFTSTIVASDVTPIHDAHLFDLDGNASVDLLYLAGNKLYSTPYGTSDRTGWDGFASQLVRFGKLDNTNDIDAVLFSDTSAELQLYGFTGEDLAIRRMGGPDVSGMSAVGIELGNVTGLNGEQIITLFPTSVYVTRVPTAAGTDLPNVGEQAMIAGGRSLAVADHDNNLIDDVFIGTAAGLLAYRFQTTPAGLVKEGDALASGQIDAVIGCNIDGSPGEELAFVRTVSGDTQLGTLHWDAMTNSWITPTARTVPGLLPALACADLDGDGKGDVIAGSAAGPNTTLAVLRGTATSELAEPLTFSLTRPFSALHIGQDINGDGKREIVVTSTVAGIVTILESSR